MWMSVCCTADVRMLPWLSRFEPFAAIGNGGYLETGRWKLGKKKTP